MADPRAPLRLTYGEGDGGFQIISQPPPDGAASASITYVGPAGWGFDPPGREGTARLANQLMTSAAGRWGRVELARLLDRMGANLSHQCAPESGELTLWGPGRDWARLVALLAEVVQHPRFDPPDLGRARRQIRERQLRETSQPAPRVEREFLRSVFPARHPYAQTGFGSSASTEKISRSDLLRFHREHYAGGDAAIVVTAPARASVIESVVRRSFREIADSRAPTLLFPPMDRTKPIEREIALPGHSQVEIRLGGRSIARGAAEYPAAFLANEILGGRPLLGRLFQRIREHRGLAYYASSELEAMRFGGYWFAQAGSGADRWRKVVPLLRREARRLEREAVSTVELDTIRESAIGEIPLALESTAEAHELAVDVAYHRLPADFWARWPETLRSVTPSRVRDAAAVALDARTAVTIIAGPIGRS